MKKIGLGICCLMFLLISNFSSAEIIQKYGPSDLAILEFVLVDSHQDGEILTRTFKLKVKSKTDEPLYDVRFSLIHASDQVAIKEGEVYLGTIDPGQIMTSTDEFTYLVDISKTVVIPEVNLHWTIELEGPFGVEIGEALVLEKP